MQRTVWLAAQTMCSVLASSSAWPVLLGRRDVLTLAADMVHSFHKHDQGVLPRPAQEPISQCALCKACWCRAERITQMGSSGCHTPKPPPGRSECRGRGVSPSQLS